MEHADISRDEVEVVRVERSVVVDAPIAEVWRALTRPDELGRWLGVEVDAGVETTLMEGLAARLREADGSVRHLLVTEVDEGRRLAWHWWRSDGELSAVEITIEPTIGESNVVRVVETLASTPSALAGGGRAQLELAAGIDHEWGVRLGGLATRLGDKLGVAVPR